MRHFEGVLKEQETNMLALMGFCFVLGVIHLWEGTELPCNNKYSGTLTNLS